jgi:hypothetical protein
LSEVVVSDVLIRDVPDDVIAAIDANARRSGLSRSEYLRRALARSVDRPRQSRSMTSRASPSSSVTWPTRR